jgi:hypothetical protein
MTDYAEVIPETRTHDYFWLADHPSQSIASHFLSARIDPRFEKQREGLFAISGEQRYPLSVDAQHGPA